MIHAYDELLAGRARDVLGRMLDFSAYSLRIEPDDMMELFTASNAAALFEQGDIRLICGSSGTELAYEILDLSGISYTRVSPRHTIALSNEYWTGYALAGMQWSSCLSFSSIMKRSAGEGLSFRPSSMISEFAGRRTELLAKLPLDISSDERASRLRELGEGFGAEMTALLTAALLKEPCRLRELRIKNGLSQSQLAKAANIPVRTLQQYEQGQKELSRARAEYLISLSRVLGCEPSSLIIM